MERRQLKRVIILILITLNAFLGLYLLRQRVPERAAAYRAQRNLLELYAADGVSLPPEIVPRGGPPPVIQLSLDGETLDRAAAFFLGPDWEFVQQGSVRQYRAPDGAEIRFHADGSFTATGLSVPGDPETLCRDFARNWSYAPPDSIDDGEALMTARYGSLSVFNCGVSFCFDGNILQEAFGILLPQAGTPADTPELSAWGALGIFQAKRRENRVVSAEIRRVSLRYALQSADGESLTLVPAWLIETDTASYYVNCVTGGMIFS